ncbi:adenine-specific DNA methylase [Rhizobium ruizarguesonis]
MMTQTYKKKLIEVAIPLEAINAASAKEKSIRHGHPSTLHLWWARRPLAACRAVLFAQLVDDPSSNPGEFPTQEAQDAERKRLFKIIEDLVIWENSTNEEVLERARVEIRRSCGGVLPPIYDPFSGGGSIPLEAQRLGLPAYGSDLNPVAVMIGKAMIEIPPKFKDMPPIHPGIKERQFYRNAEGLAEDVKYYGDWMREKAWKSIGHLYPQVDLPKEFGGGKANVIAWVWARTVPSPDPAYSGVNVPIAANFLLNAKVGKEVWLEPIVNRTEKSLRFCVRTAGTKAEIAVATEGTKLGRGANF